MSKRTVAALALWLPFITVGCEPQSAPPLTPARHTLPDDTIVQSPDGPLRIETLAAGLAVPWDFAFLPDGRVLFTERAGRIRILAGDSLVHEPWAVLQVFADDPDLLPESGLMGIALDPDFASNGHVFVIATVRRTANSGIRRFADRIARKLRRDTSSPYENRIYRITDENGKGIGPVEIVRGLPSSFYHAGGALRFGPDGLLYFSIGDTFDSPRAQDPTSRIGAILRVQRDGSVPPDNPWPGEPVFAHGLRNSQGFAWSTADVMFAIDHGPSGLPHESGRFGHDELNVIMKGGNYGWPEEAGHLPDARHDRPLVDWMPGIAPAGIAFYEHAGLRIWRSSLFVTALRGQQLQRIAVDESGNVGEQQSLLTGLGRLRALGIGPDGAIYVGTSNRDGRGTPAASDDRIFRITPEAGGP